MVFPLLCTCTRASMNLNVSAQWRLWLSAGWQAQNGHLPHAVSSGNMSKTFVSNNIYPACCNTAVSPCVKKPQCTFNTKSALRFGLSLTLMWLITLAGKINLHFSGTWEVFEKVRIKGYLIGGQGIIKGCQNSPLTLLLAKCSETPGTGAAHSARSNCNTSFLPFFLLTASAGFIIKFKYHLIIHRKITFMFHFIITFHLSAAGWQLFLR